MATKAEETQVSDRFMAAGVGFTNHMRSRKFKTALDELSVEVLVLVSDFVTKQMQSIPELVKAGDEELIITAVVGWILGMPAGVIGLSDEQRHQTSVDHVALAAYVSAWSTQNGMRFNQGRTN